MFEAQIAEGVKYLDEREFPSWVERIDLKSLDMLDGCYCVIGQLYGHFNSQFQTSEEYVYAEELGFHVETSHYNDVYPILAQEWKEKISQLRAERSN